MRTSNHAFVAFPLLIPSKVSSRSAHTSIHGRLTWLSRHNLVDRDLTADLDALGHDMRYLTMVIAQSFSAFGDVISLQRAIREISGAFNRVVDLEEALFSIDNRSSTVSKQRSFAGEAIELQNIDVLTPGRHRPLIRSLNLSIQPDQSLLITGKSPPLHPFPLPFVFFFLSLSLSLQLLNPKRETLV